MTTNTKHISPDVVAYAMSFLGDNEHPTSIENEQTILNTQSVCKEWRDSRDLQIERNNARNRILLPEDLAYPENFRMALQRTGMKFSRLPNLDLGGRMGDTGYIDFLEPNDLDGLGPIVRFTDRFQRPGFALLLEGRPDAPAVRENGMRHEYNVRGDRIVIAIFRRFTDPNSQWTFGGALETENAIRAHHYATDPHHEGQGFLINLCDNCPFPGGARVNEYLLEEIINEDHPLYCLGGDPILTPIPMEGSPRPVACRNLFQRALIATSIAVGVLTYLYMKM